MNEFFRFDQAASATSSRTDYPMAAKVFDMAQYRENVWADRYDVPRAVPQSSRRNGFSGAGHYDRTANVLLAPTGSRWTGSQATISAAGSLATTQGRVEPMVIYKQGVPHEVHFNWRGAMFWVAEVAGIALLAGILR